MPSKHHRQTPPTVYPVVELPIDKVFCDPKHASKTQWRQLEIMNPTSGMGSLLFDIGCRGMVNPLIVHEREHLAGYEVEIGNQRLLIALFLEWKTVRCIIVPDGANIATVIEHNYTKIPNAKQTSPSTPPAP